MLFLTSQSLTYYYHFLVEDKSDASPLSDSNVEAQLLAEIIAIYQSNKDAPSIYNNRKEISSLNANTIVSQTINNNESMEILDTIFGVKVKGSNFTFYAIPITKSILNALATCTATYHTTQARRYGPFNFKIVDDRRAIIIALDRLLAMLSDNEDAIRRESYS